MIACLAKLFKVKDSLMILLFYHFILTLIHVSVAPLLLLAIRNDHIEYTSETVFPLKTWTMPFQFCTFIKWLRVGTQLYFVE
jgi:hypothetical protein